MNRSGQDTDTLQDCNKSGNRSNKQSSNTTTEAEASAAKTAVGRRGYLAILGIGIGTPLLAGDSVSAETGQGYGAGGYGSDGYGHTTTDETTNSDDKQEETEETTQSSVSTVSADNITSSSVTFSGFLWEGSPAEPVTVYFEYRESSSEQWLATATETLTEYGPFEQTVSQLSPSTTHQYRAVAEDGDGTVVGETESVDTLSAELSSPSVDQLSITELSAPTSDGNLVVDWHVSDPNGDLQTVIVIVSDYQNTVQWEVVSVSGSTATGSETVQVEYDHSGTCEVTLSVTDVGGNQTVRRKQLQ